jgi:uncharacterized small protein (DUF1192 family)
MKYSCKIKKKEDNERDKIYALLLKSHEQITESNKRIALLEGEVAKMKNEKGTKNINNVANINNGTVNNINNNNNNNIILVGYGNEDLSKLCNAEILRAIQDGYNSLVSLSKTVHFNPKYPEYQNVYISNMKDSYAMMFNGNKWTLTTKADMIEKIYDDKKNYIEENLEQFVGSLKPSIKRALDNLLVSADDDDNEKVKTIKNNIKLLLYNEKQIGINSKEVYEANIKAAISNEILNITKINDSNSIICKLKSIKNTKDNNFDDEPDQIPEIKKVVKIVKKPTAKKVFVKNK